MLSIISETPILILVLSSIDNPLFQSRKYICKYLGINLCYINNLFSFILGQNLIIFDI